MVKALAASLLLVATTTAMGQEARQRDETPPLIKNAAPQPNDSPLVRAARAAVAARSRAAAKRPVIDDRTVRRGRVYQANAPMTDTLPRALEQPAPLPPPAAPTPEFLNARQRVDTLREEQQRMAEESDQGPYGEMGDEGDAERRMSQIPKEIDQAQRDMQAATPPPPQP